LFRRQPVTEPDAELLCAFNPPDSGGEFRAQQSRVRSLIGESSHDRQSLIDSRRREMELFQLYPVSCDDDSVQGEPRLGAIPLDEVPDCEFVGAPGFRGRQTVYYGGLGVFKIRQSQNGFGRVPTTRTGFSHMFAGSIPVPDLWSKPQDAAR
jgi:hypothetical protein